MKKPISFILVFALLLSVLTPAAWAADANGSFGSGRSEALDHDRDFGDGGNITLAENSAPHTHALNDTNITEGSESVEFNELSPGYDTQKELVFPMPDGKKYSINCYYLLEGNYYLTSDIEIDKPFAPERTVNLCLNGYVIERKKDGPDGPVFAVESGATLNICDCQPTRSHADNPGFHGGLITGGTGLSYSGNCYGGGIYNDGELSLYGGTITGNTAGSGGGIYNNGTLNLNGGTITGNTTGSGGQANNLYLKEAVTINSLTGENQIGVTPATLPTERDPFVIANGGDPEDVKYFFADDSEHYYVEWNAGESRLELRKKTEQEQHEHDGFTFTATNSLDPPLSSLNDVNYFLTGNVSLADTIEVTGTVNICLNNCKITGPGDGKPAFLVRRGAVLNIYSHGDGDDGNFDGLSDSGGIEIEGGGKLQMKDENKNHPPFDV